jgi:hypothetical protein
MNQRSKDPRMHERILASNASESYKSLSRQLLASRCKTPGAVYEISTSNPPQVISVAVTMPNTIPRLTAEQAAAVEKKLHNAVERILARYFHPAGGATT